MYAHGTTHRRRRNPTGMIVKVIVEAILIFLTFRAGGLEAGLLCIAAAGVPLVKTGGTERTEVIVRK